MKRRSFRLATMLAAALQVSLAFAQAQPGITQRASAPASTAGALAGFQSKEFRRVVEFTPGGELTLDSDKGSVRLTAWDSSQIEIYARIDPPQNVSEDYGRRAVEGARIDVSGDARSLTVRSNFDAVPDREGLNFHSKALPDIHYEIRAPRRLNLVVELDRSKLNVEGFKGRVKLNTDRSPLTASDLEGDIRIRIDRGEARLANLRGSLDIESDRTNGKLQAVRIEGDSRLEVDRGDFELRMPAAQQLTISANLSRRENFESDFGVTMRTFGRSSFEGTINGGGPRFAIHADRGKISFKQE
jgi:hypothetical protein